MSTYNTNPAVQNNSALEINNRERYDNDMVEIFRVYNQIKIRKIRDIDKIEKLLTPLVPDHPELTAVLDILQGWKPQLSVEAAEDNHESSHILQG